MGGKHCDNKPKETIKSKNVENEKNNYIGNKDHKMTDNTHHQHSACSKDNPPKSNNDNLESKSQGNLNNTHEIKDYISNVDNSKSDDNSFNNYPFSTNSQIKSTGGSLNEDIRKFYKFKDVLGGGSFGTVRVAFKKNDDSTFYAVKSISKSKLSNEDLKSLIEEVEILSCLDHPNIIKFYETYNDEFYFHMVMELCKGKDVVGRIVEDSHISEYIVSQIIFKVLTAINYCHSIGIVHRDIKPENILFENTDTDSEIKLIDFGLSKKHFSGERMHTILGTPYYVAPEVLKGNYDFKCDIWSIGAITYFMICGDPPFTGHTNHAIFEKIIGSTLNFDKKKWSNVTENCKDFINKCMVKDPERRFCASKALENSWFKRVDKEIHNSKNVDPEILIKLKSFSHPNIFKKLVLKFLVNNITPNDLKKLRSSFLAIDFHNTGFIDYEELVTAFKNAGITISNEEIHNIFGKGENDGKIDYTEFLGTCMDQTSFLFKEKVIQAFKFFDVNNDGEIDSKDLRKALLKLGKSVSNSEEFQTIIHEINHDKEKISLQEFLEIFNIHL